MDVLGYEKIVGIDIETWDGNRGGSLDPIKGKIALVQIAYDSNSIKLYRPWEPNFSEALEVLSNKDILKVGHNLKFDLKFFYMNNIFPSPIFDTMIASQIVYAGIGEPDDISQTIEALKKHMDEEIDFLFEDEIILAKKKTKSTYFSHSLQAVLKRELNVFLPKDVQNSNWGAKILTPAQIEYAKNDVKYLVNLAKKLWMKIVAKELQPVAKLEMEFLKVLVMLELIGIKIDKEGWKEKIEKEREELVLLEKELKQEIKKKYSHNIPKKSLQAGLFGLEEEEDINLNSSLQMAKIFGLPNVSKLTLTKIQDETIQKFVKYKQKAKLVNTYSKEYLEKLDKNNRLRSDYSQTKTATGRISSSSPNLQNVPAWFKKYIIAEPGYVPVFADYSQVELRILAYLSEDEQMIESCNSKDMHSENARKIFNIPPDQPVPSDLRKKAKTVSFAIPYGSSPIGLVERGMFSSVAEAKEAISLFFKQFPKVQKFLEENASLAEKLGETKDAIGRIRLYTPETISKNEEEAFTIAKISANMFGLEIRELMDLDYKDLSKKLKISETLAKETLSYWEKQRSLAKIRREGQNHPIQATSASITKTAMVDLLKYLLITGYGYMTLTVHDSVFFEIRKEYLFEAVKGIKEIMEQAALKVIPGMIAPVDVEVGEKIEVSCVRCGNKEERSRYELDFSNRVIIDYRTEPYMCSACSTLSNEQK